METATEIVSTAFTNNIEGMDNNADASIADNSLGIVSIADLSLTDVSTSIYGNTEATTPVLTYTNAGHLIYITLLILTTLAGNFGNICVVGAVLCDKRLKKESNMFIVNLAVADLCVTAFVDPFSIAGSFTGPNFFQDQPVLCHIIGSVCLVSCVCSLYSIAAISVNRYILLCHRPRYQKIYTMRNTCFIILGLWLFAFCLDLPNFLDWGDHNYDMKTLSCSYDRTASYSYTVFFISLFVLLPLFTVVFCNVNIYIVVIRSKIKVSAHSENSTIATTHTSYLRHTANRGVESDQMSGIHSVVPVGHSNQGTNQEEKQKVPIIPEEGSMQYITVPDTNALKVKKDKPKRKKLELSSEVKLAKTLFIIFLFFCVCWAPYALMCLIDRYDEFPKEAYLYGILIAHSSSTLNSIVYAVTNRGFQNGYRLFLKKLGFRCF